MFDQLPRPTKGYHTKAYAAISPSRPELSLKGKTVLITGGASGIGLETSKAFAQAGASKIAILARSQGPMTAAKEAIEASYPSTKVETYAVSVTDYGRINEVVKDIGTIDILMLNAATTHEFGPVVGLDHAEIEELYRVNVFGPTNLIKQFLALPPRSAETERTIIFTSTAGIHVPLPGSGIYGSSKIAMTSLMGDIHRDTVEQRIRSFSFHPAVAFTPMARDTLGLAADSFPYDSVDLPAHYAVWLCSSEADFLKGHFTWAHWDVEELKTKKDSIASDPSQLTIGLVQDKVLA